MSTRSTPRDRDRRPPDRRRTGSPLIAGPCTVETRDQTLAVRRRRARGRRHAVPRRRVQAADLAPLLPGAGAGGPAAARRGEGPHRAADRHRVRRCPGPGGRARRRRRGPGRRPQHAELRAAHRARARRRPGAAQARALRAHRRAAPGRRVRARRGQSRRHPVRARHPHVRDRLPVHARPGRGAGAQGPHLAAGDRRSEPCRRHARARRAAVARRRRRRRGRDHRRGPPRP